MACRLYDAKSLPEPMLDYCQLNSSEQSSLNFEFYHLRGDKLEYFLVNDKDIYSLHIEYYGCWWPGDARRNLSACILPQCVCVDLCHLLYITTAYFAHQGKLRKLLQFLGPWKRDVSKILCLSNPSRRFAIYLAQVSARSIIADKPVLTDPEIVTRRWQSSLIHVIVYVLVI